MRTCTKCQETKPLERFQKRREHSTGYGRVCKACAAAYMRAYYIKNPDKRRANTEAQVRRDIPRTRFSRHRTTAEAYESMVARFGGKCWGCRLRDAKVIDHDHRCCGGTFSCGACIRGVLCGQCNTALGLLRDDPELVERLLDYSRQAS